MPATLSVATRTVVVADDTAFVRDRFRIALEAGGHRTCTASTGQELLTRVRENAGSIDLIVLDLRLPQAHGVGLIRALRKIDAALPPIVVFSGTIANADEVRELAALGVSGYVNEYTAAQHILPSLAPHLFPDQRNRRSSPRVTLSIPVSYRYANTIAAAVTLNIGKTGLAIRTTSPSEVDAVLKLRFRLPGVAGEIEADGRVAWVDRRMGMGLQFISMTPEHRAALDEFVQSHFFSNRKA